MAQARKKTRRKSRRRDSAAWSPWMMLLVGLVSGTVLASLYLGAKSGDMFDMGSGLRVLLSTNDAPATRAAHPTRAEPAAPAPKTSFDFYTVLPEIERVIPETFADTDNGPATERETPAHYILQAGSYAKLSDADHLKARLVLSGFDTTVQRISIEGKGVYYRVRVGPYADKRALKNAKQRLQKMGINGLPLKVTAAGAQP